MKLLRTLSIAGAVLTALAIMALHTKIDLDYSRYQSCIQTVTGQNQARAILGTGPDIYGGTRFVDRDTIKLPKMECESSKPGYGF